MTDEVRCWLVERTYTDRDLIVLIYATPDGERNYRKELSASMLGRTTVTAATAVDADDLEPVEDAETRERYAMEVDRVRDSHEPDEAI
jgi:hypothetical protein